MSKIEDKLRDKGIIIPKVPNPGGIYVPAKQVDNLIYTSGQDCRRDGILIYNGKVGKNLTIDEGYDAARQCMINCLAVLKGQIGNLDRVKQVVKMLAFVNSADGFVEQPYVVNGASELLEEIFGEKGKHARSAISSNELPFDTPVEIELIVEIETE